MYFVKTHCTRDLHTTEERTTSEITVELVFRILRNNKSITIQLTPVRVGAETIEKYLYLIKTHCTRDVHTAEERMPLKTASMLIFRIISKIVCQFFKIWSFMSILAS